ncbi:hypothetical protein [Sandarakinorhabdus sp.]|uniref:hypothetical protein n=1 Tax=Sandarakinorhabdus sp. TaxID=1916663 RepID=UPI00286E4C03|nr:hypothetical protein [Sandarakinorhabdus sp.]
MPRVQPEELRATLIDLYGEAHVLRLEGSEADPNRVAIATVPPAAPAHSAEPAPSDTPPDTLTVEPDLAEAARFAAEIERDAALGSHADWPDL